MSAGPFFAKTATMNDVLEGGPPTGTPAAGGGHFYEQSCPRPLVVLVLVLVVRFLLIPR